MEELYKQNAKIVYYFLYKKCKNKQLAEDLTQETFLQAFSSIERFDGTCKISVWLCQIAKHLLYKWMEKHKYEIPTEQSTNNTDSALSIEAKTEDTTWRQTVTHIELIEVLKDMQKLPQNMREVIYLRITGALSFKEIGEILGKSENWARVNFYRGKEILLKGRRTMKHPENLTCNIIKDLLPSYMDGICTPDTKTAVDYHLSTCSDCRNLITMIQETEIISERTDFSEINYMKKIKNHFIKKGSYTGIFLAIFILLGYFISINNYHFTNVKRFYILLPCLLAITRLLFPSAQPPTEMRSNMEESDHNRNFSYGLWNFITLIPALIHGYMDCTGIWPISCKMRMVRPFFRLPALCNFSLPHYNIFVRTLSRYL